MPLTLTRLQWIARRTAHEARVDPWVRPRLERRSREEKEPVGDFLFDYYSLRPSHLLRWTPGPHVVLEEGEEFLERPQFTRTEGGVMLSPPPAKRIEGFTFARELLRQTAARAPHFACFGLHEWCMVYRESNIRHNQVPLRLSRAVLEQFVTEQKAACTHFDAFRFFSEEARPLNRWPLARADQMRMEQPGCIHANMDLYKWAYKLLPWISSELVADAFELAREARIVDMRASPYDLSESGLTPIRIETEQGRAEYAECQRSLFLKAQPLREKLIAAYDRVLPG